LSCLCVPAVGPISSYLGDDAPRLLSLRLAFVSTCLAFLNNSESVIGRVDDQREVARAWVVALLGERPELLHAYTTSGEHGKTRPDTQIDLSLSLY
jgi:hypothetical protein